MLAPGLSRKVPELPARDAELPRNESGARGKDAGLPRKREREAQDGERDTPQRERRPREREREAQHGGQEVPDREREAQDRERRPPPPLWRARQRSWGRPDRT